MRVLLIPLILMFAGCASLETNPDSTILHEVSVPLAELRALLVAQLPMGMAWASDNGRELTSKFFVPGPANTYKAGAEANTRYSARIALLGDRRPYEVEILVSTERRAVRGNVIRYVKAGPESRLTKQLVERIQHELAKRRDDHNVIDDFRVY